MKTYVMFDLDGTLLNTIHDLGDAVNYALEQMGYPQHTIPSYKGMVGNGVQRLIERALPPEAVNPQIVDRVLSHFKKYYDEHCCDKTEPYEGIPELISKLTAEGVNLAVTSNKYQLAVTKIIRHFFPDANWRAVLGNVAGVPRKPDPSVVFEALNQFPTPKREVLYVGDSAVDMETARRACIESVGVTWGFRPESELRAAYADHIVTSPDDIFTIVLE
ncbi:MAG: HAD family hydrolase [Bacteroidales bacterium]|nr:HAD family hydrolase [Bacteroidales bacterium]